MTASRESHCQVPGTSNSYVLADNKVLNPVLRCKFGRSQLAPDHNVCSRLGTSEIWGNY